MCAVEKHHLYICACNVVTVQNVQEVVYPDGIHYTIT